MVILMIVWLMLLSCLSQSLARITPLDPECQQALGMQSGLIEDKKIFAPPEAVASSKEGYYARLFNSEAWCIPSNPGSSSSAFRSDIYVTIDLSFPFKINAIAIQGFKNYGYGDAIKIYYYVDNYIHEYDPDGINLVAVKNLKGDDYEYKLLTYPIFTSKIRINPQYDANTKCIRLELFGCKNPNWVSREYQDCSDTGKEILTSDITDPSFEESKFLQQTQSFDAKNLLFSKPYAWCIKTDVTPADPYSNWASVNLTAEYLIYSINVDGYRMQLNERSSKYLPESFKFEYSLDNTLWASYEGGRILSSTEYMKKNLTFEQPLLARYVRIRMKIDTANITCIKLQMFGCKACQAQDKTTTPLTQPNVTNTASTLVPARIYHYQILQGNHFSPKLAWTDKIYDGTVGNNGILSRGLGCLTDGVDIKTVNPFSSDCFVGWNKPKNTEKPYIILSLNVQTVVSAVTLHVFVNESIGASSVKMFTVKYGLSINPYDLHGYACAPEAVYNIEPQIIAITLDLNSLRTKFIMIEFDYAGDWILLRQVAIRQGSVPAGALKLSSTNPNCIVPAKPAGGDSTSSSSIVLIIAIVLALLFLCLLAFVIYHYRTSLHSVFKSKAGSGKAIYVGTGYGNQREDRMLLSSPKDDHVGFNSSSLPYAKVEYGGGSDVSRNEDVYAAPDVSISIASDGSTDKPGYTQVGLVNEYAKYSAANTNTGTNTSSLYAKPNLKQQYAEPNHMPKDAIYQGSAIYASTYENPYKAVVASSLYTDPAIIRSNKNNSLKSAYKVFPRNQLSFKEKIGVGQFGEVHIAEATGLDEIYGTIGHYNSWGLPDTALVAVKLLKSVDKQIETEFLKEVEVMSRLKNENVVRLLGVCNEAPMLMVVEYMENGDLNQFLRDRKPCNLDNVRVSQIEPNVLPLDTLLHMAQQIAAGLKYLHSEGFIHRDLASRNCLVGLAYQVKISDFGMSRYLYSKHYYRVEGKAVLPIRWMAPECLFYGKFTPLTDVWSFGVTLWEILTFARESPYSDLTDPQVIENACESVQNSKRKSPCLPHPPFCPDDLYDIMVKCWHRSAENRPTLAYLYRFFTDKCSISEGNI